MLLVIVMEEITVKIKKILDDLRPYLINDGGDVEFVNFEDGIVYIKMIGACSQCEYIDYTISDSKESVLINEIPEVKEVKRIN